MIPIVSHGRVRLASALIAALPLFRLNGQSFWYDELFTVWVARHTSLQVIHEASVDGYTPPLYYLLVGALWRLGLRTESLRVLSVLGGAVCLFFLGRLATRLGGPSAGRTAWVLAGLSPFLVSLSQELRPYTCFLACALAAADVFLTWWTKPSWRCATAWGALLVSAAGFSYLSLALVPVALAASIASRSQKQALWVAGAATTLALVLSIPGLAKGTELVGDRHEAGQLKIETRWKYPLARLALGHGVRMPPLASGRDRRLTTASELAVGSVLVLALVRLWRDRDKAVALALGAFVFALAAVWVADAVTGIGVTTRYLALAFPPFVLVVALTAIRSRVAKPFVGVLLALQLVGLGQYLFVRDYFRDDWRALTSRLTQLTQRDDLVWGFPLHHLEVAARFYAPDLAVGGGYVGRRGIPYFIKSGQRWKGYGLAGELERADDLPAEVSRRTAGRRVLLVTYEDNDWHGDTRPLVESLGSRGSMEAERFPGREVLVLRVYPRQ